MKEADGRTRIVEYADYGHGFRAVIKHKGKPQQHEEKKKEKKEEKKEEKHEKHEKPAHYSYGYAVSDKHYKDYQTKHEDSGKHGLKVSRNKTILWYCSLVE